MALQNAGTRASVADLNEESNEAAQCRLRFEPVRDQVLRLAQWNFAKKTIVAALNKSAPGTPENPSAATTWTTDYPPPPWLYEYIYPSDCIALRYVYAQTANATAIPTFPSSLAYRADLTQPVYWKFERAMGLNGASQAAVVLTDARQAIFVYTARVTNTSLWDPLFIEAFTFFLAADIVMNITGDRNQKNDLLKEAEARLTIARAADGNEGLTVIDQTPDWMRIRDTYPYGVWPYDRN